jgi:hypothetical protein
MQQRQVDLRPTAHDGHFSARFSRPPKTDQNASVVRQTLASTSHGFTRTLVSKAACGGLSHVPWFGRGPAVRACHADGHCNGWCRHFGGGPSRDRDGRCPTVRSVGFDTGGKGRSFDGACALRRKCVRQSDGCRSHARLCPRQRRRQHSASVRDGRLAQAERRYFWSWQRKAAWCASCRARQLPALQRRDRRDPRRRRGFAGLGGGTGR